MSTTPSLLATCVRVCRSVRVSSSVSHLNPGTTAKAPRLAAIANAKVSVTSVPVHWWAPRRAVTDHQLTCAVCGKVHPVQALVIDTGDEVHQAGVRAERCSRRRPWWGLEPVGDQKWFSIARTVSEAEVTQAGNLSAC